MTEKQLGAETDKCLDRISNVVRMARAELSIGAVGIAVEHVERIKELAFELLQTVSVSRA